MNRAPRMGIAPILHGGFPDDDRPGLLARIAGVADESGVHALWVEDHFRLDPGEITASGGVPGVDEPLEAWTTLAWIAGMTKRVRIGSEVTPLTLRHPTVLAKMAATLDVLSGGRVELGVGTGWYRHDFTTNGIPFEPITIRHAKACEALSVVRNLWTGEPVHHEGDHYRLSGAVVAPKPVQEGGPPVWFGGISERVQDAAARFDAGWIHATNASPEMVAEGIRSLGDKRGSLGLDPGGVRITVPLMAHLSSDGDRARASLEAYIAAADRPHGDFFGENARRYGMIGDADDALRRLQPYVDLGITDFIADLRPPGIAEESVEILVEQVLPRLG
ncbi:LLM class flavin-dependent oxidoreductase [bacterium]|nr:LLM class flavin-dependent oxidoreductase [bacterium]